jgi:hypothetical protein
MAVRVTGLEPREGETAQAFVVLRFASPCDRASAAAMLRQLADVTGQDDAAVDEWLDGLAEELEIVAVPWEPPDTKAAAAAQRRLVDAAEAHGVEAAWFFQVGTSLPDIDADDDAGGDAWSHGSPPQATEVRFAVDGYPQIIDELDWEDFGIAVKLAGPALRGQDVVLSAFHSLWLSPYGGRFRNGAVTFDRTHNAAHFWVDRFASPTSAADQVHHLLWVMSQLDTVLRVVHARFAEASMTQKFGGLLGASREPFVLGGNPLLDVFADDGDSGIDSWLAMQTDWSDEEAAAMLRELALAIVTSSDDTDDAAPDADGTDDADADDDDDDDDDDDALFDDEAEAARQITGYAGDLLRERAAAGTLHPRAAERLLPVLEVPERYEQRRQAVVEVFAALRYRPAVPALIRILETTTIRSSLDSISKSELVAATAAALGAIGDASAIAALAKVVAAPGTHNDAARATAADALASCLQKAPEPRQVADAVLGELLTMICERNDGELNAESHFAYGRLVRLLPPERRAEARRKLADADTARDDAIAMLARQAALLLASPTTPAGVPIEPPPRDLQPLLRESLTTLDYDHEYTVRNLRVALRVAEVVPELVDAEDVIWLTRFAEADIRRSAHALLERLGAPLAEAPAFDRLSVRALADEDIVRLIAEPHVVGRAALITEAGLRRLADARHPVINACHDVISRARQGGESLLDPDTRVLEAAMPFLREPPLDADVIALFERMLRHSNVHVKWEIVEDAPRDERLIAPMFHVLGEKWGWQEDAARRWLSRFRGTPAYRDEHARAGAPPEPEIDPEPITNAGTAARASARPDEDMN